MAHQYEDKKKGENLKIGDYYNLAQGTKEFIRLKAALSGLTGRCRPKV